MEGIAVSIIIPIYNAEKFLRKGLDFCVNQTLQNIEIVGRGELEITVFGVREENTSASWIVMIT